MSRYSSPGIEPRTLAHTGRPAMQPDGITNAFRDLYDRYLSPVYKYCYRRLPTREDAEDATSLIFAKAFATFPDQREERTLRSWLFTIAHNVVVDHYRSRRQTIDLMCADRVGAMDSPEELVVIANELQSLLAEIPDDQAQILELRLAGLTGPEIAHVLGKSPGAVRVAQFRAYERLRQLVGQSSQRTEARDGRK